MKSITPLRCVLFILIGLPAIGSATRPELRSYVESPGALKTVRPSARLKVLESNYSTVRPGSIYDITIVHEQLASFSTIFNYVVVDLGLGAADPIYPILTMGEQGGWRQLIPAWWDKENRHIDHRSVMMTKEGCEIHRVYMLRHISEFPNKFIEERRAGYTLLSFTYHLYVRKYANSLCGRHKSVPSDHGIDLEKLFLDNINFQSISDIKPQSMLDNIEVHVVTIKDIDKPYEPPRWPKLDIQSLAANHSLYYYRDGYLPEYGLTTEIPLVVAPDIKLPSDLIYNAPRAVQAAYPFDRVIKKSDIEKLVAFWDGNPIPDYHHHLEPGRDILRLSDVTPKHKFTAGMHLEPIQNVRSIVTDWSNYRMVAMTVKPINGETDVHFGSTDPQSVPQIRLVYQLMNPAQPDQPLEQLFLHVNFDVVDRFAELSTRTAQHRTFMEQLNQLAVTRKSGDSGNFATQMNEFLETHTKRPVMQLAFSSSLTGIWIFGALSRAYSQAGELEPLRIIREGVDVGYYSSLFDNDLFIKAEQAAHKGKRKQNLRQILADQVVTKFRDPKRNDVKALTFSRVTCAQCHNMSSRDGPHVAFNDHTDARFTNPVRATEFLYTDMQRMLKYFQKNEQAIFSTDPSTILPGLTH